ncbi:YegS/Rv2252/BmrU family lipid kinase [Desulfitispora alkaliphila]|uniref:diacylglycerol/lipid kinase family protein n=1 Tax=Desulfitispora alkaliphila TaxID=622674 RepID=UPI003D22BBDB
MKVKCVVNPVAGKGRTEKSWQGTLKTLQKLGFYISWDFTEYRGHGKEISSKAIEQGYQMIVAVGGDGTLNEVINGLGDSNVKVGLIPTGTGNDFARTLEIPLDPIEASILLGQLRTKLVDLGQVNGRKFLNMAGIGVDANVAQYINEYDGFLKGHAAYLLAMLKAILKYKPIPVQIKSCQGDMFYNVIMIAVANAKHVGGGIPIAPEAVIDDGNLDIIIIEEMSKLEIIKSIPLLLKGEHLSHPKVHNFKCKHLEGISEESVLVHADGDIIGYLPQTFYIEKKSIEIIVP